MRAKKSLGQNFLCDDAVVRRIVDALDLKRGETVVEIGPGQGALTGVLLEKAHRVIAIEFDRDLIGPLQAMFDSHSNFQLIGEDALQVDFTDVSANCVSGRQASPAERTSTSRSRPPADAGGSDLKLVANLPYNISTPILQRLMDQRHVFSCIVLMFQKEVVQRITSKPGGRDRGFLSVLVENAFDSEYLFDVPPTAFSPVPKVWSAVVRLTPKPSIVADELLFKQVVSMSFVQRRKTILNNLKLKLGDAIRVLETAGIDGKRRAQSLTLAEWARLTDVIGKPENN